MQFSGEERVEFVSGLIGGLLKVGCSHKEVCDTIGAIADILEAVKTAGMDPDTFVKQAADKNAVLELVGSATPWATIGGVLGTLGNSALNSVSNTATNIAGAAANNAIPAIMLGPVAAGAAGYGGGQLLAQLMDRPNEQIQETKHQELLSVLRQNARRLRADRHHAPVAAPKPDKKDAETSAA